MRRPNSHVPCRVNRSVLPSLGPLHPIPIVPLETVGRLSLGVVGVPQPQAELGLLKEEEGLQETGQPCFSFFLRFWKRPQKSPLI